MKIYVLIAVQFVASVAAASSVSWDSFLWTSEKNPSGCEIMAEGVYRLDGGYYNPAVIATLTFLQDNLFHMTTFDYTETAAGFIGNWNVANKGDIVSADTIRGQGEYLNHCKIDGEAATTFDYMGKIDEAFYLMFAVADVCSHVDGQVDENVLYGWVEFVFSDGSLEMKRSAIGLDGQSMTVGAIPEPSSAVLLLIGCAVLFLRRGTFRSKTLRSSSNRRCS